MQQQRTASGFTIRVIKAEDYGDFNPVEPYSSAEPRERRVARWVFWKALGRRIQRLLEDDSGRFYAAGLAIGSVYTPLGDRVKAARVILQR